MSQLFLGEYLVHSSKHLFLPILIGGSHTIGQSQSGQTCRVMGLVDTGATKSLLRTEIVEALQLADAGQATYMTTANNQQVETPQYSADIVVKGQNKRQILANYKILAADNLPVEMLIGMDIISTWHMDWHGSKGIVKITALTSD